MTTSSGLHSRKWQLMPLADLGGRAGPAVAQIELADPGPRISEHCSESDYT